MTEAITIGIDLAKNVLQVHGVDAHGNIVVARRLRRKQVLAVLAEQPSCLIGMEACGSAHYWGRELTKLGHRVRLMPPKYVKAYVKRGKTDAADAEAICEAVGRPSMTFVAVKSVEQQGLAMLHSVRQTLIGQRTQAINALRGHLSELGIVAAKGMVGVAALAEIVRDESDTRLPALARAALLILMGRIDHAGAEIARLDGMLMREHKSSELGARLDTIPSIGPVIASALRARVTDARQFKNGRHMAAWIGVVPEQDQSGGKVKQKGISKKGDARQRCHGRGAAGAAQARQASLGRQAADAHARQGGGDRRGQQDGAHRLGDHGAWRPLPGRPSPGQISTGGARGDGARLGNGNVMIRQHTLCRRIYGTRRKAFTGCEGAHGVMTIGRFVETGKPSKRHRPRA